ncbi:exodeoxyribonuclease VII small subunit [Porticoccaceae bacterium]|nr:exodeoxyribonuclease VII small subunit [Porticoccaceae bacterium]MDA8866517.1 exodeoxyribonuclease VII small subunit [Porticoccaceae bacterium]MDB2360794.1 exodeoxyribonuclease VII small subunit [Porticoccaceae bacterium]MDB2649653.1 exodeoxyribonuclease VII small subunit [Porticoccaceae bacterium]
MSKDKKAVDFEQQLASLEGLVNSLESGELSLEESLKSFEQGIKVARDCQAALKSAEQKVEVLMRQGDELVSQPFEDNELSS